MLSDSRSAPRPKVSVVVPVFNVRRYLRECMDSVLSQTLEEIEILCGDGGSTDGSLEILREYEKRDSRVRVVSRKGSGYGQSVNECVRLARGEYVGIVESDDAVRPQMYETLYARAKRDDLDWVRGDVLFYRTGTNGKPVLRYERVIIGSFYNRVLDPRTDVRPYRCRMRTWSGIYRRAFLQAYGIEHNETPGGAFQDIGFYLSTMRCARRVEFVHEGLYMWRQDNAESSTHDAAGSMTQKTLREWALDEEKMRAFPELDAHALAGFRYRQFLSYLWAADRAEGTQKEQMRRVAREALADMLERGEIDMRFFTCREKRLFALFLKTGETRDLRRKLGDQLRNAMHKWGRTSP